RDGNGGIYIHTLPFKAGLLSHRHLQQKISGLASARSGNALSFQADALSGLDSRGNVNLQGLQAAVLLLQADHLIAAEGRLVKADGNLRSQIRALLPAAEISEAALIK